MVQIVGVRDKRARIPIYIALCISLLVVLILAVQIGALNTGSSDSANLTIYDDLDLNTEEFRVSGNNIIFYANFTNSTSSIINATFGSGICQIHYNFTGGIFNSLINMTFNSTSRFWRDNRTFSYKGNHTFEVVCNSTFGNVSVSDSIFITNTAPLIRTDQGGTFIDLDGNTLNSDFLQCSEDTLCIYNFSANVTEPDLNDVLTFSNSSNTTLTNFSLNSSSGIIVINITTSTQTGNKQIELTVRDTESSLDAAILRVNVSNVNDAPVFLNLQNRSFNATQTFNYLINTSDEENDYPFNFNITFLNCSVAQWSNRDCSTIGGRTLFDSGNYTLNGSTGTINISFTPSMNDVGNYTINFTVTDAGSPNATRSEIITFTVQNINQRPIFKYICDNERTASEDTLFNCYINASDSDEALNLTYSANETWFTFNDTELNSVSLVNNLSTNYNSSALVNFTPRDNAVGNWFINITVLDLGNPSRSNSTIISFNVSNKNDSVFLNPISNLTAFTSNNYTIYVNASDSDLFVPDKNVFNEALYFTSNTSWVNITSSSYISDSNITQIRIDVYPNITFNGINNINITVRDSNNFSSFSRIFAINVSGNFVPVWFNLTTNYTLTEGSNFLLNLSRNVSDGNNDILTFFFTNTSAFPSLTVNRSTGIINFTPTDFDVGYHEIIIYVNDSITPVPLTFNFTVLNINDNPSFILPLTGNVNVTIASSTSNITGAEDNYTVVSIFIEDDDFKILNGQKSFYNETLSFNLTIVGPNTNLFNFTRDGAFPTSNFPNRTKFDALFTPNRSDIGRYNITLNVSDYSNSSIFISFNLTILSVPHAPSLSAIGNKNYSILEEFYFDFNFSDTEDINETYGNFSYSITNLTFRGNFLSINRTSGIINITLNQTLAGVWQFNVSINDSSGLVDYELFNLTVYDYATVLTPVSSFVFNMVENSTYTLNFSVNHSVGDMLNYSFFVDGNLRNSTIGNGNATPFYWNFMPNFTDENCGQARILTLNVSNEKLTNSSSWNLSINHTNLPIAFTSNIGGGDQVESGVNSVTITLSDYFNDIDAVDLCHNQTIGFSYTLINNTGGTISVSVANWSNGNNPNITFSATSAASANYSIVAFEFNESNSSHILKNVSSNNFSVSITISTVTVTTPGGGGGGGGGSTRVVTQPVSLRLILPGPLSVDKRDRIELPITLYNDGSTDLNRISLTSLITFNGSVPAGVTLSFDSDFIPFLAAGSKQNVTLIANINTDREGLYEISINASSESPAYSDWGKIYLNVKEGQNTIDKIIFTEELLAENPECAEIQELLDEAKRLYDDNNFGASDAKLDEAISACKQSVAQRPSLRSRFSIQNQSLFIYLAIASVIVFALAFGYYLYKQIKLRRILLGEDGF